MHPPAGLAPSPRVEAPLVLIVEVMVQFPAESVRIENEGSSRTDLVGWRVTDGEGTFVYGHLLLEPRESITLTTDLDIQRRLEPDRRAIATSSADITRSGRFGLADEGDQVILLRPDGSVADALCYGKADPPPCWMGNPIAKPGAGKVLLRMAQNDTDSAADWSLGVPGSAII